MRAPRVALIALWVGAAVTLARPALAIPDEPELLRFEYREMHMGSEFKLLLYCASQAEARSASRAAFDRIAELNRSYSDYDPESELMRLCDQAGGPPVPVSTDLFDILTRSLEFHRRSGGLFDVTIGPVGRLWRRARRDRKLPDRDLVAAALAKVGSDQIRLDAGLRTVQLLRPGMKLDLGGIAKGYASQAALEVLRQRGIPRALAAGAGDIVVGDPPPDAPGWVVGVAPLEEPGSARPALFLSLARRAVSTSGDAERFVAIDGTRYSHIVDPKTGMGKIDRAAVTVVARDGATADALATAVYLLGPDRGFTLIDEFPDAAALFVRHHEGGDQVYRSSRWNDLPRAAPRSVRPADGDLGQNEQPQAPQILQTP